MEQRVSLVTLGVADVQRSLAFYERLGWRGQEVQETVFFQAGGQAVVLWSRQLLAEDCGIDDDGGTGFSGIALAHNVGSRPEVDRILEVAKAAGAEITKPAAETFYGGYAGYFRDLDGHFWEIAFNPGFELGPAGELILPDFSA